MTKIQAKAYGAPGEKAPQASGRGDRPGVPTMSDVAKLAGVSPMTVSRVMNGDPNVRPATRRKVDEAVAALNYVPNQAARRLAGARAIRIGFLYSNPSAGYLSEFLVGLLNQASIHNVQLVVENCEDGHTWEAHSRRLIENGVDGIILPPPLCDTPELIELIALADMPAATVACGQPDPRVGAVSIDDYQAAYDMTSHLISLGHHRIGFVIGHPNQTASARRLEGYKAAIADKGGDASPELVAQGMFTYRSGLDAAEILLGLEHRPTAVFASNDDMAAATVAIAHRLGLDVPGDLTVAGFDDTALATTIWPELTTVRQPIAQMAEMAVQFLVRQIRAQRDGAVQAPEHIVMDFSLIRRQSDAAPRRRPKLAGKTVEA
ncbi:MULTISPECIES: LacI family DNA-binding transcriptional regulator [Pseudoduganella]|uniref:LacI family DNA-binding transcriptional regulator n=1 Tax=Pseudoduganella albidiflava TaxID=321983 RepID=A0A411X2F4_9BURK|nr:MULTISPECIES: LacI family DNA-binding transcriptional regulator [Pseudoduganella]QBI03055.1 LacI family DNA-binding transcriptional regulator [Pseudoduganella albidiflava]GGY58614.1 LacI family transcriptional regulator [Pseudoduganella albidiflava]